MSIWGHVFAAMYDRMIGKTERAGLGDHRQALLANASGDVLEIGGGTGANLDYYGDGVRTLTIVEPEKPMLRRLQRHIEQRGPQAKALRAPRGTRLPSQPPHAGQHPRRRVRGHQPRARHAQARAEVHPAADRRCRDAPRLAARRSGRNGDARGNERDQLGAAPHADLVVDRLAVILRGPR